MCGINKIAYSSNSNRQTGKSILRKMRDVSDQRRPDDVRLELSDERREAFVVAISENKNGAKSAAE